MMRGGAGAPVFVVSQNTQREQGHRVQLQNINAAKNVADVIRTSLGPRAMLKMLMDPMGGIVLTNDGNAMLREITVKHPAAKSMIEIARTQDEETGDGTTSVIVLAGEVMSQAEQFLEENIHPTVIIKAYRQALEEMIVMAEQKFSKPVDLKDQKQLETVVRSCLATKMMSQHMDLAVKIALDAVQTVSVTKNGHHEIDLKRYCRVEKIPGGAIEDSSVVKGVVLNKDIGISDMAQHFLVRAGITALRRLKKTDNNRLARVCGARIVNDTTDLREEDVGTQADLYEIKKIGDEYFTFVTSEKTTAVTVVLRGPSKDIINEVDRNIQDAVNCARNVLFNPKIVPGAGALEMALSHALNEKSKSIEGVLQWPYQAIARALEVIPRTLIQNCGGSTIRQLTALRAKHAQAAENWTYGIDGTTGEIVDVNKLNIWDPLAVRVQVLKTAIESSIMLLRIDDIISGTKKRGDESQA
ncbi:T-complex protein 1 subunit gamma [Aphelenchoides fujianensis]|nr:T-complex protein 1 subunit gamma [Aphelenchoides fujianensis]